MARPQTYTRLKKHDPAATITAVGGVALVADVVINFLWPIPAFVPFLFLSFGGVVGASIALVTGIENAKHRAESVKAKRAAIDCLCVLRVGVDLAAMSNYVVRLLNGRRTRTNERLLAERFAGDASMYDALVVDPITITPRATMSVRRNIVISANASVAEDTRRTYGDAVTIIENFKGLLPLFNVDPRTLTALSQKVNWRFDSAFSWLLPFAIAGGILGVAGLLWAFLAGFL